MEKARANAAKWAKENPERNREKARRQRAFMLCGEREPAPQRQPKPVSASELNRRKQRKAEYNREYSKKFRIRIRAQQNERRAADRDHVNALHRLSRKRQSADPSYRERRRGYIQRFRSNNPDYDRQWRAANREKVRQLKRAWYRKSRAAKKTQKLTAAISQLQQIQTPTPSET